LQDVFCLVRIAHLAADEVAQPRALARNDFREARSVDEHGAGLWRDRAGEGVHAR